ncbi:NADP-dependent oxidoreductase [Gloeocapsopsis crepidinum LEGE 06123]|uniref:NADP-dependent oxidoreductase n=2 Tax=Gloeocapsopsis crepidinum TaxID=693223 RepID=A0ABR9UMU8_9CHRO|nr:NADP-dependent oxidoreductase [Gloeocapsopsis crepidinum LEGE 06123]
MKAVRIHSYGGSEVLKYEDTPRPDITDDEILVQVHAVGVNPVDWKIREGYMQQGLNHKMPLILGWDVSGVVAKVGSNVNNFQTEDDVYAYTSLRRNGAYAEYIAIPAHEVAHQPKSLDYIAAASVPVAALTAYQALFDAAKLSAGQTVLIHAAAGGVGSFAVQLAKNKGARVIGTASARNHSFLKELGVDEAIDYNQVHFEDVVYDVDVVFDTIGDEVQEHSWKVLKSGGILVSIVSPPSQSTATQHKVRAAFVAVQPNKAQLAEIAALVDAGILKPIVDTVLPLSETRQAHELSQSGHMRGKIVLQVIG